MKIQCTFELTDEEFEKLWRIASNHVVFHREDPRKRWSLTEKKEVVRKFVDQLVDSAVVRSDDENR